MREHEAPTHSHDTHNMRTLPRIPQPLDRSAALLREQGHTVYTLVMGPFDRPLTLQQRDGIDRLIRDLHDHESGVTHITTETSEVVHALVINPKRAS